MQIEIPDGVTLLLIGVLVLLSPVLILMPVLGFLFLTGDLLAGNLSLLELLELYVIELALFVVLTYGLYRLVRVLVVQKLTDRVDDGDADD
jgi:hypothetical protein